MAKYKVLKPFIDKETRESYKGDKEIELSDKRAKEINDAIGDKYIKRIKQAPKKKAKKESKEAGD